jgi:hypothetical protein
MNASYGRIFFQLHLYCVIYCHKGGQGCDHLQIVFLDLASRLNVRCLEGSSGSVVADALWEEG